MVASQEKLLAEIHAILEREGLWRHDPPDPPTMRGITLRVWNEYCSAKEKPERSGEANLKNITEPDAIAFYLWYFPAKGLDRLIEEFKIPTWLVPHVMDLRVQHSLNGCRKILRFAKDKSSHFGDLDAQNETHAMIALSRNRYLHWLAEYKQTHLRREFRGLSLRTLKAIGWWPIPETGWAALDEGKD